MANNMDVTRAALNEPVPPAVQKILDAAVEHGWSENPCVSLVVRLAKLGDKAVKRGESLAKPFFMTWELAGETEKTHKRSWRFTGARAANGQPLSSDDCLIYLQDPSVIYPTDPNEEQANE